MGLVLVKAIRIIASVFSDDDSCGLHHDYDKWLEKLAPHEPVGRYLQNPTGEDNADANQPLFAACRGGALGERPDERYCQKRFEPALLDALARDAGQEAATLPLLQLTLQELWSKGSLKRSQYASLTDAIQRRAELVIQYEDYGQAVGYIHRPGTSGPVRAFDFVKSARFSPDGKLVLTASDDGTARLWSVSSGQELAVLRGHSGWIKGVDFSPDGELIVTASEDGTARLWEADSVSCWRSCAGTQTGSTALSSHRTGSGWSPPALISPPGCSWCTWRI
jgi:hypothetical protein